MGARDNMGVMARDKLEFGCFAAVMWGVEKAVVRALEMFRDLGP
jgi:hypothetical protein